MVHIKLKGTPPTTNTLYVHVGNKTWMSATGKTIKEGYQWEMKMQFKGKPTLDKISVIVEYFFKDNHRRDIDNFAKAMLDAGTGILWKDDSQIQELILRKFIDPQNPRVELTVM